MFHSLTVHHDFLSNVVFFALVSYLHAQFTDFGYATGGIFNAFENKRWATMNVITQVSEITLVQKSEIFEFESSKEYDIVQLKCRVVNKCLIIKARPTFTTSIA